MSYEQNLIEDETGIRAVVQASKRVAVLGIKTEQQQGQPAFYVPQYLADAGVDVVPVPVYYPDVTHILGKPVFRRLAEAGIQVVQDRCLMVDHRRYGR